MDINHVHLHVRDISRARAFYDRWFGFATEAVRQEGFLIVRNPEGFDLALNEDADPANMPPWFHVGCRLPTREAVQDLHDRMVASAVPIETPLKDFGTWMRFACRDPDGYAVEVYYE